MDLDRCPAQPFGNCIERLSSRRSNHPYSWVRELLLCFPESSLNVLPTSDKRVVEISRRIAKPVDGGSKSERVDCHLDQRQRLSAVSPKSAVYHFWITAQFGLRGSFSTVAVSYDLHVTEVAANQRASSLCVECCSLEFSCSFTDH